MANDRVDGVNKASQDLAALHDKDSLHKVMSDMQALKAKDHLDDPEGKKQTFQRDLAQIAKSVDLKGLGLEGFHVTGYGVSDNGEQLIQATKAGAKPGDKDTKIINADGDLYKVTGPTSINKTGDNVFVAADNASRGAAPAHAGSETAPAKVADNGDRSLTPAPAEASAAAADNSFGTHGRTYEVNADGKAFYPAKHGDTYWAVARDLLTKPDHQPTNTEILAQVNALATLNNKSDAGKLKVGEPILLPITPAAAPAPEAPPVPAKDATVPAKDATVPAKDATVPAKDATVPAKDATVPAKDATVPAKDGADPAPAAPVGFDMKAHAGDLKPQNGVHNPLSPLGMSGAGLDTSKADLDGAASKPVVDGTKITQETKLDLKDGYKILFGYGRTGVTNTDVTDGNILKSRDTKYDSAVDMKMAGPKGAVDLHGVTHVISQMQDNGTYRTEVTAGDGVHTFVTDSSGKVQRSVDANNKVVVLETPSADVLAALNPVEPATVADAAVPAAVVAKPQETPKSTNAVDVP